MEPLESFEEVLELALIMWNAKGKEILEPHRENEHTSSAPD